MILHENRLPADDSHEISCLFGYFWNSGKIWNCPLLQIIGGAFKGLRLNQNMVGGILATWRLSFEIQHYCLVMFKHLPKLLTALKLVGRHLHAYQRIKFLTACLITKTIGLTSGQGIKSHKNIKQTLLFLPFWIKINCMSRPVYSYVFLHIFYAFWAPKYALRITITELRTRENPDF